MAASPARAAAYQVLLRVERDDSYASELLHSASLATLSSRDHGLATELVMGVLRWQLLLDQGLANESSQKLDRLDPEVLCALRLGLYQLRFLSKVPVRAAIFESVELVKAARKRSAASFVNAVLRKIARVKTRDAISAVEEAETALQLAQNASHPLWLVTRWAERYGLPTARKICLHNQAAPVTAIHLHEDDEQSQPQLAKAGIQLAPGRLLSRARFVLAGEISASRPYQEGRVSIQDETSQLVALLAGATRDFSGAILDCCAAPGSKTSVLARRHPHATVFATELHAHRARRLRSLNQLPNVRVVTADARQLPFAGEFARILADVPCSGTGTLARNPEIKKRLALHDLFDLQSRQIGILKSALGRLAVRGRLLYATCSLEAEENEAVVAAALAGTQFQVADLGIELEHLRQSGELCWNDISSLTNGPYLRTIPGVHPGDGFFAALIERR
jgi:16S rRNA (cytosine967-C5)-methyltransferase